jgi:hypothetical protein
MDSNVFAHPFTKQTINKTTCSRSLENYPVEFRAFVSADQAPSSTAEEAMSTFPRGSEHPNQITPATPELEKTANQTHRKSCLPKSHWQENWD